MRRCGHKIGTDGCTDGRTDGRTDGEDDTNIQPPLHGGV